MRKNGAWEIQDKGNNMQKTKGWKAWGMGGRGVTQQRVWSMVLSLPLTNTEHDACLGGVVRGHFHFDLVADDKADEALAHFTGNVGKNFVTTGKSDFEHGASQNGGDSTFDFNGFIFALIVFFLAAMIK